MTTGNEQLHAATPARPTGAVATALLHGAGAILALVLLPLCLAIGVPWEAWAIAFGAVVFNRLVHLSVHRVVRDATPTVLMGALGFSMIFRALLTALALFFVGAELTGTGGDRTIGLGRPDLARPAIIVFMLCFTLDAGIETVRRASQRAQLGADDLAATPDTPRETTA